MLKDIPFFTWWDNPVHSSFTITIEDSKYTDSQKEKYSLQILVKVEGVGYNGTIEG
jgi:hypothetical protein